MTNLPDSSPTPLNLEQLAFFTAQTERAVKKGVRYYRNRAMVGFVALLIGLGGAFYAQSEDRADRRAEADGQREAIVTSGRALAVDGCNRDFRDREGLRNVLIAAQVSIPTSLERGDITKRQAEFALNFYAEQLRRLPLPDCRDARGLLTADPNEVPAIPTPLFPVEDEPRDSIFRGR